MWTIVDYGSPEAMEADRAAADASTTDVDQARPVGRRPWPSSAPSRPTYQTWLDGLPESLAGSRTASTTSTSSCRGGSDATETPAEVRPARRAGGTASRTAYRAGRLREGG